MARLYREAYGDIKKDKEFDYDEADRIYNRFDYLKDGKSLQNRMPSEQYNVTNEQPTIEEELFTTELSEEELDLVYKRYKVMQGQNLDRLREVDEEA